MYKEFLIKIIKTEMDAVQELLKQTESQYDQAINLMKDCKGKLIFMGIGKSGHIGKKLAATFSSTGTPSFFVHSAEAFHGDFGMIEDKDVVILISNSGNTREVTDGLSFLKRIGCQKIAFTSGKDSLLAKKCDALIIIPKLPEADHLNLAPTVSSTLTLVLGDAIACTLSRLKGFKREDFYKFHPGGALGDMLSKDN